MGNDNRKQITAVMVFIIMFGTVSLFSDMTHEAASSIRGAFFSMLGASAATIGFVSGLGELIGYSLRYVTGIIADKTGKYWSMTIIGYTIDVAAVPALAMVSENGWVAACALLIIQRIGKAIKKPSKDTLVSFAASQGDTGKSFGIVEGLDQIGAFLGPLLLYIVMLFKTDGTTFDIYSFCFAILAIPGAITLFLLFLTKKKFPNPENFEPDPKHYESMKISKSFRLYIAGISLFAFGFIDYAIVIMYVSGKYADLAGSLAETSTIINSGTLPLLYAGAMLVDAVAALAFGFMFDRHGVKALVLSTVISAPFAVFIFAFDSVPMLLIGIAMWGIGMGAQESILKAAVTEFVPKSCRATGYGIFELAFGASWFLGSWLLGVLYDLSLPAMITVSVGAQLAAVPLYIASASKA